MINEKVVIDYIEENSWDSLFSENNIKLIFLKKIYPKGGRGVDRISVSRFRQDLEDQAAIISRKCKIGTYKFSPYLEQLISKGRNKPPRVVSIPTIRDKIVLKILTEYLHDQFESYVARDLPNTVIKKIKNELAKQPQNLQYIRLDLASYYDSIPHDQLIQIIKSKNEYIPFVKLLNKALTNPTMPANYSIEHKKKAQNLVGIPQGLSISNILAELYCAPLDRDLEKLSDAYFRFVDDIFILCHTDQVDQIWQTINNITFELGLKINKDKSTPEYQSWDISKGFEFLGYNFLGNKISVRKDSYDRFLHSIIGKITKYRHSSLNEQKQNKSRFIEDLNERITGAIDGNKKYGWTFFFSEINDIDVLEKIDLVVKRNINRLQSFSKADKALIKRATRAYYEVKHSPKRGYIHNYNKYDTIKAKVKYLDRRGILKAGAQYTNEQIVGMFNQEKTKNLLKLERDVSNIS